MIEDFKNLSKEELLKIIEIYSKNWLAHDGCWFLSIEEKYGIDIAIELDKKSWERFSPIEAKRIMKTFNIESNGGLKSLEKSLKYRLYSGINKQEIEWIDNNTLIFRMIDCRVQHSRISKNLEPFPCKQVGIIEYSKFASTIDKRIKTECISCPPDPVKNYYCAWQFVI